MIRFTSTNVITLVKHMKNITLKERFFADMDNEQIEFDDGHRGVALSKTDYIKNHEGKEHLLKEKDYIYLYMDIGKDASGQTDYVFAEGHIPDYPNTTPCKWCCKYAGDVLYRDDYQKTLQKNYN